MSDQNTTQIEIGPDQYEVYKAIILSGQIPQEDVPSLLADNPKFAEWYKKQSHSFK